MSTDSFFNKDELELLLSLLNDYRPFHKPFFGDEEESFSEELSERKENILTKIKYALLTA